jgi:hypothetical protein
MKPELLMGRKKKPINKIAEAEISKQNISPRPRFQHSCLVLWWEAVQNLKCAQFGIAMELFVLVEGQQHYW